MKNQKLFSIFSFFVTFAILFGFFACSKSTKSDGNNASVSNSLSNNDEGVGIMITAIGIPERFNRNFLTILLREKEESEDLAAGSGQVVEGSVVDMKLIDMRNGSNWTKTGKYYIGAMVLDSDESFQFIEYDLKNNGNLYEAKLSFENSSTAFIPRINESFKDKLVITNIGNLAGQGNYLSGSVGLLGPGQIRYQLGILEEYQPDLYRSVSVQISGNSVTLYVINDRDRYNIFSTATLVGVGEIIPELCLELMEYDGNDRFIRSYRNGNYLQVKNGTATFDLEKDLQKIE